MPENGSVNSGGGASSGSSASGGAGSSSGSDNSAGSSAGSNESQTTEESLSSSPTTGDTLSGGQEASKSDDSGKSTESNNTETHTNGDSDSDKANENNSSNNQSNNAAANDNINHVADSGKEDFDSRNNAVGSSSGSPATNSTSSTSNNTGSYDEVPSVAVSMYSSSVDVAPAEDEPERSEPPPSLPEGVPNEYAEHFGVTPNIVGGVDAVWSNPDGSFSSSDGSTYNPATKEKTYDVGADSFATTDNITGQKERHPDRVRSSEALAIVDADPNNMAKAHGNTIAFDYYNNPNLDGIREQAFEQVETRRALAEGTTGDIGEALANPLDGAIGLAKGMANGVLDVVELVAKGSVMNAASQQYKAAAFSSLLGNNAVSDKQMELGDELFDAAKEDLVPSFELENRAQKGGAAIGLAIDIATGVKGLATGAAKLGARNADEFQGIATDGATLRQTGGGSQAELADEMYDAIRNSETDVKSIAENTGFKEQNIQSVKDHVFNDEHLLDRYVDQGEPATIGRFDSNVNQAEAWNRLEAGTHTPEDINWMKHETAESWYEKKYDSGYSEAHDRVEDRWSGNPWGNE